jgi:hypothetical protein
LQKGKRACARNRVDARRKFLKFHDLKILRKIFRLRISPAPVSPSRAMAQILTPSKVTSGAFETDPQHNSVRHEICAFT